VLGGAFICADALGLAGAVPEVQEEVQPDNRERFLELYEEWKRVRHTFSQIR